MSDEQDKPLARSVGEFFGHIFKAFKTKPDSRGKRTVKKESQTEDRDDVILRRTTIEEIEFKDQTNKRDAHNS